MTDYAGWLALAPKGAVARLVDERSAVERAARRLCARKDAIALVDYQLSRMPWCERERLGIDAGDGEPSCPRAWNSEDESAWHRVPAEELAGAFCPACLARVPLWRERRQLRAGLGALMAALMRTYRRSQEREAA